ncbi:MAG: CRISPR-associated endoribonuclease Cas6 [Thermoflexus sp.]|uniref:CRISPR-associated endoribonuclease Cas6 n=1 Tax=Thermoflexus sp. TaxID=1969742 RepID=UPI0033193C55
MRLKIVLGFPRRSLLPWDYPEWLRGLAYTALGRGVPQIAQRLHEEGWRGDRGRRYKPLTYSWLHGLRPDGVGLWAEGSATWWIASPIGAVVEALALGLLRGPDLRLGPYPVQVERVEVEPIPSLEGPVTLVTLSPITLSTGERRPDGRLVKRYLSPEEPAFEEALVENLRRKAEAFWGRPAAGEIRIRIHPPYRSKLVRIHGTDIRGWMFTCTAEGDPELLRLGYLGGLGEHTASGFGMVALAPTADRPARRQPLPPALERSGGQWARS